MAEDEGRKSESINEHPAAIGGGTREADPTLSQRLQVQLDQLRLQVRRLNEALAVMEQNRPPVVRTAAPAAVGVKSVTPLAPAPQRDEGSQPAPATGEVAGEVGDAEPGTVALLTLADSDLAALIRAGYLLRTDIGNPSRIGRAVQQLLTQWRYSVFGGDERTRAGSGPGRQGGGERQGERRSGRDRRRAGPRSSCLLSYVEGTPFDRRKAQRRRSGEGQGKQPEPGRDRPSNLIHFDEARAARLVSRTAIVSPPPLLRRGSAEPTAGGRNQGATDPAEPPKAHPGGADAANREDDGDR